MPASWTGSFRRGGWGCTCGRFSGVEGESETDAGAASPSGIDGERVVETGRAQPLPHRMETEAVAAHRPLAIHARTVVRDLDREPVVLTPGRDPDRATLRAG